MWDGQRWVPTGAQAAPHVRRSRGWIWWLAGGCGVLLILGIAGGIYGMVSLVRSFQSGGLACLPSDFPQYPGTTITHEYTYIGTTGQAGDSHECAETLDSSDDVATVRDFYSNHLDTGDWHVTSNNASNGTIEFARVSRPQTVGSIQLLGRGQQSAIVIKLFY